MSVPFKTRNLQELFSKLQSMLSKTDNYELNDNLSQTMTTYSTMLQYMVKGVDDPNAGKIYLDLVRQCYQTGFRSARLSHIQNRPSDKYSQTYRIAVNGPSFQSLYSNIEASRTRLTALKSNPNKRERIQTHDMLEASQIHQTHLLNLFNQVWTSDQWQSIDYETGLHLLQSDSLTDYDKSLFVSSVTLSLLEMFDERKLMILFDGYDMDLSETRMRSAVGILLTLRCYDSCIDLYPKVSSRLSLALDNPRFLDDIYLILMQLEYSKLTDQVSAKMQNDIIPTLLESGKFHRTEYGIEEIDEYLTQNGENPEWHKGSLDDVAEKKIHEMAELQMEGADVQMSTFIHMKNGPFFSQTGNWFMPFSIDHPDIISIIDRLGKENSLTKTFMSLLETAPFCNSDRYSFSFMIDRIGTAGQQMLDKNISKQMGDDELREQVKEMTSMTPKDREYSRYYIHDLYRFFIGYPYHPQFDNPFSKDAPSFTPLETSTLSAVLESHDNLLSLAEFFMRKEQYSDALKMFDALHPEAIEEQDTIWQKIGFCQQKCGDIENAIHSYTTAYTLNPGSQWTLKHLAQLMYHQKNYSDAEVYYDLLIAADEENLNYLKRKVDCQLKDNRYSDALPLLYKLNYLDEESLEVKENLACCLLMTGSREKSKSIYESILTEKPDSAQYNINLANIYYLDGDMEAAYSLYSSAYHVIDRSGDWQKRFKRMFVDAAKTLKILGIDIHKFQMMYDAVVIMNPLT